jgi:MscS family membrane protein
MSPDRLHARIAALFLAIASALAFTPGAHAQSLSGALTSGNSGPGEAADLRTMRQTALGSFRDRADRLINEQTERSSDAIVDDLRSLRDERIQALSDEITQRVDPLRADGLLSRAEAVRAIGEASEAAWLSFAEAVQAKIRGLRAPPRRTEFESGTEFVLDMSQYIAFERNGPLDYLVLLSAVAVGILIAWGCSRFLVHFRTVLEKRDYAMLPSLVNGVRGPLYFTLALAGIAIGLERFWLPQATEAAIWIGLKLAFIVASLWLVLSLVNLGAQGIGWTLKTTYREPDKQTVAIIRRSLHLLVLAIYALIIAEIVFGVELQSVLIGVGLLGLAVTLAAQDTLKNLFGSLTLVIDRPFRVGDLIEFQGYFGTVEDIGFRSTKLRELDGHLVTIPNAELVRESVENVDARPWVRRRFRIGIRYDTPPDKVREGIEILTDILSSREDTSGDMAPHVVFEGFGGYSLNLLVQYCLEPGEYWDAMEEGSDLHIEILDRFNEAGIEFAFPTQTAVLETDDNHAARFQTLRPDDSSTTPGSDD